MSTIVRIAVGVVLVGCFALVVAIAFMKQKLGKEGNDNVLHEKHAEFFFSGLEHIHVHHPRVRELYRALQQEIVGMDYFLHGLLLSLFAGGHVLVEGAPGLAKTKTIRLLASLLALDTKRVQFTPDMLPADLIGVDMFNHATHSFETFFGPLFTNILLADEINRATPKVQSALLEAMQEKQVSIGGKSHLLQEPFFVLATQNPIEQDGTYPLPEAQLDRFLTKLQVSYPSLESEKQILQTAASSANEQEHILTGEDLLAMQQEVAQIAASDEMLEYIARIADATRAASNEIDYGVSPRGSLAILSLAKAVAYVEGRSAVTKDDIRKVILPALGHRIIISMHAQMEQKKPEHILFQAVHKVL